MKSLTFRRGRPTITYYDLAAGVLVKATAVLAILCAASLAAWQVLVHSHFAFLTLTLGGGRMGLSAIGALVGCAGVLACRLLEGRSYMRRWFLYVYALAFLVSSFVLLMQWFEVSGASGFWS